VRDQDDARRQVSRRAISVAPVAVVVVGLGLALGLVLLGARLAASPAALPDLSLPGTRANPRPVNVIMRDYAFNPTPLYLVRGETVRLQIVNGGLVAHEFVLGGESVQHAWAAADAAATPPSAFATAPPASVPASTGGVRALLGSGESASIVYDVPVEGPLELVCHLAGHVDQGMTGQVVLVTR
jgi:uncharacterized cupredoxin-like copper-binding protein